MQEQSHAAAAAAMPSSPIQLGELIKQMPRYSLSLMPEDPAAKIESNKIYVEMEQRGDDYYIKYKLLTPEGMPLEGAIPRPPTVKSDRITNEILSTFALLKSADLILEDVAAQGEKVVDIHAAFLKSIAETREGSSLGDRLRVFAARYNNDAFNDFAVSNEIKCLSSTARSIVCSVNPIDGSEPYVLRLTNRLENPNIFLLKSKDDPVLNSVLPSIFYSEDILRGFTASRNEERTTQHRYRADIINLCSGGNLQTSAQQEGRNDLKVTTNALNYYQQMATIYTAFERQNVGFPDGKNTNWLIDSGGRLRITDCKSLITLPWEAGIATAVHMRMPEYQPGFQGHKEPIISMDKMNAYIIGKNLYHYLTNCSVNSLIDPKFKGEISAKTKHAESNGYDAKNFDFSASIFKGVVGEGLRDIILNTVNPEPSQRLSVQEIQSRLEKLESLNLQQAKIASASASASALPALEDIIESLESASASEVSMVSEIPFSPSSSFHESEVDDSVSTSSAVEMPMEELEPLPSQAVSKQEMINTTKGLRERLSKLHDAENVEAPKDANMNKESSVRRP